MRALSRLLALCTLSLPLVLACGDKEDPGTDPVAEADADTDSDTDTDTDTDACGTAGDTLPEGLVEIAYDNGTPNFDLEDAEWSFDGSNALGEIRINESVSFQLDRPALIHGFAVHWSKTGTESDDEEVSASLAADFGHNGFDFWPEEALWEGTRCAGDIAAEQDATGWTTYAFDAPVELVHPGLIYVTHQRQGAGDAAWSFDGDYLDDGDCASWKECSTAVNAPDYLASSYWNGTTSALPYDYLVRLYVEYTDEVADEDKIFQPSDAVTPSSRQAWADYDNDGDADLFTNGPALYRNEGDGSFTNVTDESGMSAMGISASGGTWGDYDNDGCLDLIVFAETYAASESLLHSNCDGTFSDATASAGFDDTDSDGWLCESNEAYTQRPTTAAAWWDLDNDGLLDLYLANMICWNDGWSYVDEMYRNNGDGSFSPLGEDEGFVDDRLAGRGAAPIDADLDGDVDLLVSNYRLHENLYYQNNGDGTVDEKGLTVGLEGHRDFTGGVSYYGHTIGSAWGDLDNDGDFDVIEANLGHPRFWSFSDKTQVLINQGDGTWDDIQGDWETPEGAAGLRYQETHSVPTLFDVDQDGVLDLAISAVYDGRPTDFYWGLGDGTFVLDAWRSGIEVTNGWGMAAADADQDGDLDLAAYGAFYLNEAPDQGHWVQVRAIGDVDSNWAAIGATVWVKGSGGQTWLRHIGGGTGQGDQDDLVVHVGLGDETELSELVVWYPGGETVTYTGPFAADQRIWVTESGAVDTGFGWPDWE